MNDRDLRSKKQSLVLFKTVNEKVFNNSHIKIGPNCEPKQPPNISRHYMETKKKQSHSREIVRQEFPMYCYQVEKVRSKILMQTRPSRPNHSKNQQDQKIRKTKREPHYISKPHKAKQPKINSKENRQSHSNVDTEDYRRQKQKMTRTQVFDEKMNSATENLTCKEKIIKKLKKNLKPMSLDLLSHCQGRISSQNKINRKSFAEEMLDFEAKNSQIQIEFQSETLTQLFYKQQAYFKIENYNCYLIKRQPDITWTKRAKAVNWMIQILSEIGSKRQTFALAVNYMDRYLAATCNLPQEKLQTLACAAMSIANKVEGQTFHVGSFRMPGISFSQILDLEQIVCKTLKWKLNPPTMNMWANRIAQHWDMYLDHHLSSLPPVLQENYFNIKFKDTESYLNFRTLMQYIDLVILDVQTLQYHNRELAASFIYIILTQKLSLFGRQYIFQKFPYTSRYLLDENPLNDFFCQFVQQSFGFALQDLLPTIQYCSTYIMLPLTYELPVIIQESDDREIPFSEFCSLLTCNSANLAYIYGRSRDLD